MRRLRSGNCRREKRSCRSCSAGVKSAARGARRALDVRRQGCGRGGLERPFSGRSGRCVPSKRRFGAGCFRLRRLRRRWRQSPIRAASRFTACCTLDAGRWRSGRPCATSCADFSPPIPTPLSEPTNRRCDRERVRACLAFADSQTARRNASCISIPKPCALRRRSPTRRPPPAEPRETPCKRTDAQTANLAPGADGRAVKPLRAVYAHCAPDATMPTLRADLPHNRGCIAGGRFPPSRRFSPSAREGAGVYGLPPPDSNIFPCPQTCPLFGL